MSFLARMCFYEGGFNPTFVVASASDTNLGPGGTPPTYTFYGWDPSNVTVGTGALGPKVPAIGMGSCSTPNPGANGISILGAYSSSGPNLINAVAYYLVIAGTISSGFSTMNVAGTALGVGPTYQNITTSLGATTLVTFTRTDAVSLFAGGGNKTVIVT